MSESLNVDNLINVQHKVAEARMCRFKEKLAQDPNLINVAAEHIYKKIIDDFTWEFLCNFHRAYKFGYADLLVYPQADKAVHKNEVPDENPDSVIIVCPLPHCDQRLGATKYAKHLFECMFKGGRKSKRVASKRITHMCKGSIYSNAPSDEEEEASNSSSSKPTKLSKKSEGGKKNKKHSKQKNSSPSKNNPNLLLQPASSAGEDTTPNKVKNLPVKEHMAYLSTYCSSKSDSLTSSKPQKSKSQSKSERTVTRKLLSSSLLSSVVSGNFINIQDLDLPAVGNEMETGVTLSPTDSNSSLSSSSSSYKRKSK